MGNKVKFKLKKAAYAPATIAADGSITYETPVIIPGAVAISLSPEGDLVTLNADGGVYYVGSQNGGYSGDLEMAKIPDIFAKDCLGENEVTTDKVMIEKSSSQPQPFALILEFSADVKSSKQVLYLCYSSRYAVEAENPDKNEPKTEKVTIKAIPRADEMVKAKTGDETTAAVESAWFTEVYEPAVAQS